MSYASVLDSDLLEEHFIPFLGVADMTCCIHDAAGGGYNFHYHSWCTSCAYIVENASPTETEDTAMMLFQEDCKHCHTVRMVRAVSTKFHEAMDRTGEMSWSDATD